MPSTDDEATYNNSFSFGHTIHYVGIHVSPSQTVSTGAGVNQLRHLSGLKINDGDLAARISRHIDPLFPALRSGPTAVSGATRQKRIPSSHLPEEEHHDSKIQKDKAVVRHVAERLRKDGHQ